MTSSPTQYYLIFKNNGHGDYDVYESHSCQEKGCLWTTEEYVGNTCLPGDEAKFVEEYNNNLIEGKVVGYEIDGYIEVVR
jgi:hypothetical protein